MHMVMYHVRRAVSEQLHYDSTSDTHPCMKLQLHGGAVFAAYGPLKFPRFKLSPGPAILVTPWTNQALHFSQTVSVKRPAQVIPPRPNFQVQ